MNKIIFIGQICAKNDKRLKYGLKFGSLDPAKSTPRRIAFDNNNVWYSLEDGLFERLDGMYRFSLSYKCIRKMSHFVNKSGWCMVASQSFDDH